jgi:hypothetical protein
MGGSEAREARTDDRGGAEARTEKGPRFAAMNVPATLSSRSRMGGGTKPQLTSAERTRHSLAPSWWQGDRTALR